MAQHVTVHWHSCWALLFHLQEATHKNAKRKHTNARFPDHVLCRTRSAHAGAPSGMLFNEQRSQEVIFCLAENHFHEESSLLLPADLACHLEPRTSNHATNVGGCAASFAKHATAAPTARAQKTASLASGLYGKHASDLLCQRGHMHCNHRRVCTQPDRALSRLTPAHAAPPHTQRGQHRTERVSTAPHTPGRRSPARAQPRRRPRPTRGWCAQTRSAHTATPPAPETLPRPPRRSGAPHLLGAGG